VEDWTVGYQLNTLYTDNSLPYTLIVGRNARYNRGEVHPNGGVTDKYPGMTRENIFVGGEMDAPDYLLERADGGNGCGVTGCLDFWFDSARECYQGFSNGLAAMESNAHASIIYGDGLLLTCASNVEDMYAVNVDASMFNQIQWFVVDNCNLYAEWIINIGGNGGVVLRGESFPSVTGGVVYNILNTGRTIEVVSTGLFGHLLAPSHHLVMNNSVIIGKVVVASAARIRQTNRPCPERDLQKKIEVVVEQDTPPGQNVPFLNDVVNIGDVITLNGKEYTVIGFDDQGKAIFVPPLADFISAGERGTFEFNEMSDERRPDTEDENMSSAVATKVFFALIAVIVAFL